MRSYDMQHNMLQLQTGKHGITNAVADAMKKRKMMMNGGRVQSKSKTEAESNRDRYLKAILKG